MAGSRIQFSIATGLLLTATISVWIMFGLLTRRTNEMSAQLQTLKINLGAVVVADPGHYAIGAYEFRSDYGGRGLYRYSINRKSWSVFVPKNTSTCLTLKLTSNNENSDPQDSTRTVNLAPGYHTIVVCYDKFYAERRQLVDLPAQSPVSLIVDGRFAIGTDPERDHKNEYFSTLIEVLDECSTDSPMVFDLPEPLNLITLSTSGKPVKNPKVLTLQLERESKTPADKTEE